MGRQRPVHLIWSVLNRLIKASVVVGITLCLVGVTLLALPDTALIAAPLPPLSTGVILTKPVISATKVAVPVGPVSPGSLITYTINISSDASVAQMMVTDTIHSLLVLQSPTVTGTPATSVTVNIVGSSIRWTITDLTANTPITLSFAALVTRSASNKSTITNTAWLSTPDGIFQTNQVNHTVVTSYTTYVPSLFKPEYTILSVKSINAGNFITRIRRTNDSSIVATCNVPNNQTSLCDTPFLPGTYIVDVIGTVCGSTQVQRTFPPGPTILPIACN